MTPERWRKVEELYQAARQLDPRERSDFLAGVCHGDDGLRSQIEALLGPAGQFLDQPNFVPDLKPPKSPSAGDHFGPYEIIARIGAGGMGEVFSARDTRLGRTVALKLATADFGTRFEREARAVAALNHPNICTLHDVGPNYLVMEFIEGESPKGPLPVETALHYARQIADALETAHEKGIVHRDLKPANIKVKPDGTVKVLDFGLAKAFVVPSGDPLSSPTVTMSETEAGTIMGTAAYMSPEQATGQRVDKRADIWSFGVLLWELLTGRRLFAGDTVSHTLADVLRGPIDFDKLPRETPAAIRGLLQRCLERNARNRLRDIGEARIAIDAAFLPVDAAPSPAKLRPMMVWIVAALLVLSLGALAFVHFREVPPQRQHFQFQIAAPVGTMGSFRVSPDARFLAFATAEGSTQRKMWVRSLDTVDTRLLTDIQGLRHFNFFWSRDGEQVAFQSADKLYKIPRNGGQQMVVTDAPDAILGGVWLEGGVILFGTSKGLFRVSASGGAAAKIDDHGAGDLSWLPGGRFLYVRPDGTFAGSLDGSKPVRILPAQSIATYVPPAGSGRPGQLLFLRGETLMAQAFNANRLELQGDAVAIEALGTTEFSASENGVLVVGRRNQPDVVLTWLDRFGGKLETAGKPFRGNRNPAIRLSPDNSQAIVPVLGPQGVDLWIADLKRNTLSRFTFNGSSSGIWSPDGRKVLWTANDGNRYLKSADGSGKDELLFRNPTCVSCYPTDWSSDGQFITTAEHGQKVDLELWLVPTTGDRKPYPYVQNSFATYWGQISPDNRWMAYGADQPPQPQQVYVESIPPGKGRWQISTESGDWPIWRRDGKELFYREGTKVMAVPMRLTETTVEIGKPQALFEVPLSARFQVSRDGQRFLVALPADSAYTAPPLTVDTDWRARLKK